MKKILNDDDKNHNELKLKLENIIKSSELDSENKFKQLQEVSKKEYGELFSKLQKVETAPELLELAEYLDDLAELNIVLGNLKTELKYYTDGAICCEYVLAIISKHLPRLESNQFIQKSIKLKKNSFEKLSRIEQLIVQTACGAKDKLEAITEENIDKISRKKNKLEPLREKVKKSLELKEEVSALFKNIIIPEMKDYLSSLHKEAESIIGKPPCKYTVIGLGSMALGQMTPYSDLEYAIITKNDDYKQSNDPKIQNYFKNLSYYVEFKVICLGETIIPTSYYNVDMSYFIKPAVNLDLGGKVPLGRHDRDKPYELIGTIEHFLKYVINEGEKIEHIDKALPYILEKPCFVYGEEQLFKQYKQQIKDFLNTPSSRENYSTYGEQRAVKMLLKGTIEIDYRDQTRQEHKMEGNINQFAFQSTHESSGRIYNIKQEIYRLPDRLIYNLGQIYGIESENGWEIIGQLAKNEILNREAANNLKNALSFATALRLKAYSYYGYQNDTMGYDEKYNNLNQSQKANLVEQDVIEIFRLEKAELQENGSVFRYYYTTIPLTEILRRFCYQVNTKTLSNDEKYKFFKLANFYKDNVGVKASICLRLLKISEALKYQLIEVEENEVQYGKNDINTATSYYDIGWTYRELSKYEKALEYHLKALKIRKEVLGDNDYFTAASYTNVGLTYQDLGQYEQALEFQLKTAEISEKVLTELPLSSSYNNVGHIYAASGKLKQALEYFLKSLKLHEKVLGDKHVSTAVNCLNVGTTYSSLGCQTLALKYLLKALNTVEETLGIRHTLTAFCYNNIGEIYRELGKYKTAQKYSEKALKIREEVLGNKHSITAGSYNNVGVIYGNLGDYKKALEYQLKALRINKKILGKKCSETARSYTNIGEICTIRKEYTKALNYHLKALKIKEEIIGSMHTETAISYNNTGATHGYLGNHKEALNYYLKALKIYKEVFGEKHPSTALCYNNIGCTYFGLEEHKPALKYQLKSLIIDKEVLGEDHPTTKDFLKLINLIIWNEKSKNNNCFFKNIDKMIQELLMELSPNPNSYVIQYLIKEGILVKTAETTFLKTAFNSMNLATKHYLAAEFQKAYIHADKAIKFYLALNNYQYNETLKTFHTQCLIQLGNSALLQDNEQEARKYYEQANPKLKDISFQSIKFFQLIASTFGKETTFEEMLKNNTVLVTINSQKAFMRLIDIVRRIQKSSNDNDDFIYNAYYGDDGKNEFGNNSPNFGENNINILGEGSFN